MFAGFISSGAGGGSFTADGTLPTFTTMSALDAALTAVGRRAQLAGATTGEVILTCVRKAAGAGGLAIEGPVTLWQADGTEFDGAFAWVALAGGDPTWGVAGDAATGGLILSVGYAALGGFRGLDNRRLSLSARAVAVALPVSPDTGNGMMVGAEAATAQRARLGGLGYTLTNPRPAGIINADTTSATPSASYGPSNVTVADGATYALSLDAPRTAAASIAPQGNALRLDSVSGTTPGRPAAAPATGADATDYRPIFFARNMTARFTELFCGEFA